MAAVLGKMLPIAPDGAKICGNSTEKLPVVEPKPFVSKEWRPCNSIPDLNERRSVYFAQHDGGFSPRKGDPVRLMSDAEAAVRKLNETHSGNSYSPRKTTLIHPRAQADCISIDAEQAFATFLDRQKSTIEDIKNGGNKTVFSCFRRAMSEIDLSKQQDMRIQGQKMREVPLKSNNIYLNSWEYKRCNDKANTIAHASVSQSLPNSHTLENLYLRLENIEYAYMDNSIYDAFDRSSTLPSINVRNAPMKIRGHRAGGGALRQPSAKVTHKPGYKLGVANSLDVLSHYGRPTEIEQHLSSHLKRTIKQIKTNKDSPVTTARNGMYAFSPRGDNNSEAFQQHDNNSEAFKIREQHQRYGTESNSSCSTKLNLEGPSVMSSHSFCDEPPTAFRSSSKATDEHFSSRPRGPRNKKVFVTPRGGLSSSVPHPAVSARVQSMMRAKTLPGIAPGRGVRGFQEMTSSRFRFLSNSAPETRDFVPSSLNPAIESRIDSDKMSNIAETGPHSTPVSSPRSSVSSEAVAMTSNNINVSDELYNGEATVEEQEIANQLMKETEEDFKKQEDVKAEEDLETVPGNETEGTKEIVPDKNSNVIDDADDDIQETCETKDAELDQNTKEQDNDTGEESAETAANENLQGSSPEPVVLQPFEGHNELL